MAPLSKDEASIFLGATVLVSAEKLADEKQEVRVSVK